MACLGRPAYHAAMLESIRPTAARSFGDLLRYWREHRRMSQLHLAVETEISTRHLSFIETGRAQPSREMVIRLAEHLAIPLRERNALLLAAGFAPLYRERPLDDPELSAARQVVETVLQGHEPFPALAVDRHWQLLAANRIVPLLLTDIDPALLQAPVNVLRLSLHPQGLASRIVNLSQWRTHLLARLRQQVETSADPVLLALLEELRAYPAPKPTTSSTLPGAHLDVAAPLQLTSPVGLLSFISTTTVFGTPVDVTLSELAVESFFPADSSTAERLRQLQQDLPSPC